MKRKTYSENIKLFSHSEMQRALKLARRVLNEPEEYDFSTLPPKQQTITNDELNFYIPEKWRYL